MLRLKLHAKFLFLVLGVLILFLGILSALIVRREANLLADKAHEQQHLLALTIYSNLRANMMKGTPRSTLELINGLRGTRGLVRLEVLGKDGHAAFGMKGGSVDPRVQDVFAQGKEISFQEQGVVPLHTILYPLKNGPDCWTCHRNVEPVLGVLLISLSRQDELREIQTSTRQLALFLAFLIALLGGVLYLAIRMVVLEPLRTLTQGAERIGQGDLTQRIVLSTGDELQDLAQAFNAMAGRLEESYEGLEEKIRNRTSALHAAADDALDKADRLFAYSRDLATISRLSTKIFNADLSLDELLDRFMTGVTHGLGYKRTMLCLTDRKRVWLDIKRDTGAGALVPFRGQSLLSNDPFVSLVRRGKVEVLDSRAGHARDLYCVPLLNRTNSRRCWQIMSCIKSDCPAYNKQDLSCWLEDNTLCGNPIMETYGNKLAYCMSCPVFPVIGVLVVVADDGKRTSRTRRISVLRILAAEMSAALENHRLHDENRQMVRELLELHRVTAAALADLTLTKALEVFTDSALRFAGMDACAFWLVSPDGRELVRMAGCCVDVGEDRDFCPSRLPVDEGLLGNALRHNEKFVVDYNVARNDPTLLGKAAASRDLPSLLAVPLKNENGTFGVFSAHKRSTMPFLDSEIAAFMLLANQAAMAINVCKLSEELKNQNLELVRQTNLLGGILSSMTSGILLISAAGAVTLINQAGAAILRARQEDLVDKRLTDLYPEAGAFLAFSVGPYQEVDVRLADGSLVPIGFSSAHYSSAPGEQEGVIVVFRDLSELKALRAELLNKERFATMGRVVAGVAHEIRNPLFGISSVGQILEREVENPAHRDLVRALLSETKRMNSLVEELLVYARPMKLQREDCDLAALWKDVLSMHQGELERREIAFSDVGRILRIKAYLDPNQIRQLLLNLLRNAMDATPPGGTINARLLLEDRYIIFQLSDSGMGISADAKDKIFDLFYTTKPKGTGLGLPICRKIAQDHGGEISVESKEQMGTTVTVKLPYREIPGKKQLLGLS